MVVNSFECWLLGVARALPVVALHPVFGAGATPRQVKLLVAAALAMAATPSGHAAGSVGSLLFAVAVIRELAAGVVIGAIGLAVFGAIESAGRLVDDARGANVASLYAPQLESGASPLGQLELSASLAVYWGLGLHAGLVEAVVTRLDPVAATPPAASLDLAALCAAGGELSRAGLALAGSAVVACVLVDALAGVVNRSAPGANVFALALPLKLAAACLVTAIGMPAHVRRWSEMWSAHDAWIRAALALALG
jgi:flagellar biosynthetic protein FliR